MLEPKRQKYRKQFRGIWRRMAMKGADIAFGTYALKSMEKAWIKDREIEAVRLVLARATRKNGKFWIRIFPDKPFTKKPPEVTMGAGKGDVSHFVAVITPGRILFEVEGLPESVTKEVMKDVAAKLSVTTKLVSKFE